MNHILDKEPDNFEDLQIIAEGNMLVSALFLPSLGSHEGRKFKKTTVYFDTKFLLGVLGHAGPSFQAPNLELVEILRAAGASLGCFQHTCDEVKSVLKACARGLSVTADFQGFGPTYNFFLSEDLSESDVLFREARVEKDLSQLDIAVETKPPYHEDLLADEREIENALAQEINYSNPYARIRDVDSLSSIIRLRGDRRPRYLEASRAIFVTSNTGVVRAAKRFQSDVEDEFGEVDLCVSDLDLTNLVWLKRPLSAPDLPRRRIIADFYGALQPSDEFRTRYLREVEKLEDRGGYSVEDVYLLRHSIEAQALAMELTLGDEEGFSQGTVGEVLEVLKQHIKEEEKAKVEAAKRKEDNARAEAAELKERVDRLEGVQLERKAKRSLRASNIANALANVVAFAVLLAALLGLWYGLPYIGARGSEIQVPALVTALILAALTFFSWVRSDPPILSLKIGIKTRLERPVERILIWMAGD